MIVFYMWTPLKISFNQFKLIKTEWKKNQLSAVKRGGGGASIY